MTKWVKQKDSKGCGFACVAMITGKKYDHVKAEMLEAYLPGLATSDIDEYLAEHGYYVARKFRVYGPTDDKRSVWPVAPFAPLHWARVKVDLDTDVDHFVVVLKDGTVLDPLTSSKTKRLTDYPRVYWVAGIYKPQKDTNESKD